jgi:hypothetical protein
MTVPVGNRRKQYPGNGIAAVFNGPMAFSPGNISTYLIDDATGTTSSAGAFTVTQLGKPAGTRVTMTTPPPSGYTLVILLTVPYSQETDITNQSSFNASVLENGLDLQEQQIQQLAERQSRSIFFGDTAVLPSGYSGLLPAPVALAPLVWKPDLTGIENGDPNMTGDMLLRPNLSDAADPAKGAALVGFNDKAAPAFLKTVSDILNGVPVDILRNIPKSRWAGIQNRTDTEDCADAIMALMDGASAARVAELRVPTGTFTVHKPIQRLAGTNPFRLVGDDWRRSIIARGSDWAPGVGAGSVFNITGVDNHSIENLRILGGATLYPVNANHAIACSNSNHVTYRRLYIEDWLNSGILVFHFPGLPPPVSAQEQNNVIEDCYLVGNGASNNGILFVDQFYSYIRGCTVRDIGKSGSPQAAIQFKNLCYRSRIDDCIAINARSGVSMGQQDVVGIAAQQCSMTNTIVRDCVWGIYMGSSAYCDVSNINIDMNNQGSHGIEITDTQECSFTDIKLRGQQVSSAYSVKFGGTSSDNFVQFSTLNINDTIPEIVTCDATALNNMVRVEKLKNTATLTYTDQGMLDNAPTVGNGLEIGGYTTQSAVTIASGVILLKNPRVQLVRVNTEASAATDDLDTITGTGRDGQIVTLKTTANSRDVTVKHGTGNIRLVGSADFAMLTINYRITLQFDAGANAWVEIARSASP